MLISLRHHLVILATPKCASTAIEAALGSAMDIVMAGAPGLKHTTFRKYDRFLRPYLETYTDKPFETVCLFREPVDWLASWWRYRSRESIPDPSRSARGMTFDQFVNAALDDTPGPGKVGRQARFVSRPDGTVGVDRIFRYDNLGPCLGWLGERLGTTITLDRLNVSPPGNSTATLDATTRTRVRNALADDFHIYETIAR